MKAPLLFATAVVCFVVSSDTAAQQMRQCGSHDPMVAGLLSEWGEKLVLRGLNKNGNLVEIFASPDGTFTILGTMAGSNTSCVYDYGKNFKLEPCSDMPTLDKSV